MEDEQFLTVATAVPWWRYNRLWLQHLKLKRQWLPQIETYEQEDDHEILCVEVRITKQSIQMAVNPKAILGMVALEVVEKLQTRMRLALIRPCRSKRN